MDLSPFLHPGFLVTVLLTVVSYVAWQVRLEGKISSNTTSIIRNEAELKDVWKEFEEHRLNADIHFNLRVSQQVDQGNERRFNHIERQLTEINTKLDKISSRQ